MRKKGGDNRWEDSREWTALMPRRTFLGLGIAGGAVLCAPIRLSCYGHRELVEDLQNLSSTQGAILMSLVEAMLPPEADRRPEKLADHVHFIDGYLTGMDPSDVEQLRALILLMEHLTLPLAAHPLRFTRMGEGARIRYLRGWQTSRVGLRRLGFRSLKTLIFLVYYRDPEAWEGIGYPGPIAPHFAGLPQSQQLYDSLLAPLGATPSFPLVVP